ncbi:hypothetical protein EU537_07215 [Candidatus Thorarchaeota archaeon]|nr:MAG: hypothetical protein EU537_07215 [Candidatus Thorarchaeota archaeon]
MSRRRSNIIELLGPLGLEMPSNILGCMILELNTGQPLYSHFFDDNLKENPSLIPQRIRSNDLKMVHQMGRHMVFTALVTYETPEVRQELRAFKQRVEEVYPEGLKRGSGTFADYVILQDMVTEIFRKEGL